MTKQILNLGRLGHGRTWVPLFLVAAGALGLGACGGGGKVAKGTTQDGRAELVSVQYGRLVDVYAYRRIDVAKGDRRDRFNRRATLVARDVVIGSGVETQPLFDASGEEIPDSNWEFRSFDVDTGHEELLILWDDRDGPEQARFQQAMSLIQAGLSEIPAAYREQNTAVQPIPVVPRNAALRLRFSGDLGLSADFFTLNPSALQVLEFKGDPRSVSPVEAFRQVPVRILVQGDSLVVDTTILGREGGGLTASTGLPVSVDNVTANIRLAIPSRGSANPTLFVPADGVANLNGIDSFGRTSVIRDFRSGNLLDGRFGTLSDIERPMIVGNLDMGITAVDPATNTITLNKRFHQVPIRGRFPFVEGMLTGAGLPTGPSGVPIRQPLRSGDFITQQVDVTRPDGSTERVRVRAEILRNMEIGTVQGSTFPGRTSSGSQGEMLATARVQVASLFAGVDSQGNPVSFQANSLPAGQDCAVRVHYYENVPFLDGSGSVSDSGWRHEFLVIEPKPAGSVAPGTMIDPNTSVAVAFSEPMDLARIDNTDNLVITNSTFTAANFATLIAQPKPSSLSIVPTRLTDQSQDGTLLMLTPDLGHHHVNGTAEQYWLHVLLGTSGVTDLAGNPVQVYDNPLTPTPNWSVPYTLDPARPTNLIGWRLYRFADVDEDGTPPGSVDMFGQFRVLNGRLLAAETVRFSRTADNQNLGGISRINRGECWNPGTTTPPPGTPGSLLFPTNPANGGALYWQPRMYDVQPLPPAVFLPPNTPQDVGRVIEPHQPRGSRMMMRYLEDDFSLDYRRSSEFMLDVEQLYWSPFNDETVLFDVFDRYTMALCHSDKRPDIEFVLNPNGPNGPECQFACPTVSSNLSQNFADNILRGSGQTIVFEDKVYQINPNDAFRAPTGNKYVPYPEFDRSYTWRDSRLITMENGAVLGLGGARDPRANEPTNDWTAHVDSPWVTSRPDLAVPPLPDFPGTVFVLDEADFRGNRVRDLDPIALPLLVDFKVFPDDARNGIARGVNAFQIAMIGPPSAFPIGNPGGYYNSIGVGCAGRLPWPWTRIHTTGGRDPITLQDILVDPANVQNATGGWVKDAGLGDPIQGLFQAPPGDGHLHWAQADFVRRVSMVTLGFFDSLQPNRHGLTSANFPPNPPVWSGRDIQAGFPNLEGLQATLGNLRIQDLVTRMDPPNSRQPAGTSVVLEVRGAETFANATVYDQVAQDLFNQRGNLLNPNYACEAYRYSTPNSGANGDLPRVAATGLTRYVTEDQVGQLRDPVSGLLPRYLNTRLVMTNNITVSPGISPSLRSLSVVYRMAVRP